MSRHKLIIKKKQTLKTKPTKSNLKFSIESFEFLKEKLYKVKIFKK